jgi:mannose/fructose/N-acetylgalactosamine-specific phosphotransferase system component IIC
VSIWKFLHVVFMFGAVTLVVSMTIAIRLAARSQERAVLKIIPAWYRLGDRVGGGMFLIGIGFGFVTAVTSGFSLTAPWLIATYVLVGLNVLNGWLVWDPKAKRLNRMIEAGEDEAPEVKELLLSRRRRAAEVADIGLWVAIIFTMVMKPFGW